MAPIILEAPFDVAVVARAKTQAHRHDEVH